MRGIVLAGGTGSRLWPATTSVSKQLLPVYDKPMIYYPLATLMESGIRDILIISRPQDADLFTRLLGDGGAHGVSFSYAKQPQPNGIAAAFQIGKEFLRNAEACALVLGDNLFHGDSLATALRVDVGFMGARIFAYRVSDPESYGVVEFDAQGRAIGLEEKPRSPKSSFAVPGLYVYGPDVVSRAEQLKPSARGELEITHLNEMYLAENLLEVRVLPRGTAWLDTGTFDAMVDASAYVKTIEARQGTKVACLEEIAWRNGWITDEQLEKLAGPLMASGYGEYLMRILDAGRTDNS